MNGSLESCKAAASAILRTALYRHYAADGTLLYVGISLNAMKRLHQHNYRSHWFEEIARVSIEWHESRDAALEAETAAILQEQPMHNVRKQTGGHFTPPISGRGYYVIYPCWSRLVVHCRGDRLSDVIWQNDQWAITEQGLEARDGLYFIEKRRLHESNNGYTWSDHMLGKAWVNMFQFDEALDLAQFLYPQGRRHVA